MRFPYVRYGAFDRPIVPVTFRFGTSELTYEVLVDTGADISVAHRELAEALGIGTQGHQAVELAGIAGIARGFLAPLDLTIGTINIPNVPVIFTDELGPQTYGILGHRGLFDRMRLRFDYARREFSILKLLKLAH